MEILLVFIGAAGSALGIWLAVRIVNRRERWAKRIAIGLALLLAYPVSFGPACWLSERTGIGTSALSMAYQPMLRIWMRRDFAGSAVHWYARVGMKTGLWTISKSKPSGWLTIDWTGMM